MTHITPITVPLPAPQAGDYCASSDIWAEMPESAYGTSDSTGYNNAVSAWITAASRLVDRELGVEAGFFNPVSTDAATRYFDGSGAAELDIGCWCSVAEVAVAEEGQVTSTGYTVWDASDYLTWPYNRLPIRKLITDPLNGAGSKSVFTSYRKAVRVTGVPGYSLTPPEEIAQAVRIQVARWLQRAKQMWQDQGGNAEVGSLSVAKLDVDIEALLGPFRLELS